MKRAEFHTPGSPPQTSEAFAAGEGGANERRAVLAKGRQAGGGDGTERISPRRVDEVRGASELPVTEAPQSNHSADAPPRPGGRDTRLTNTRATAEQRSRDRLKKTNDCAFVLLIL